MSSGGKELKEGRGRESGRREEGGEGELWDR